jgi:hypothetical protein
MSNAAFNRKGKEPKKQVVRDNSNRIYISKNTILQREIKHKVKSLLNSKIKKRSLSKDRVSTFDLLGYSIEEFKIHIESLFQPGMTWENHGNYDKDRPTWHIDHKIADCWFDYSSFDDEDFKKSWSLSNLQPLWAKDNLIKNKYVTGGGLFQLQ